MNWGELLSVKLSDGRTLFEYLFGESIVEVNADILQKPIGENALVNINRQLERDGIEPIEAQ